jgi:spermidine/putrescine transport system ATP-binding protein
MIELRSITKRFGDAVAVDNVDLSIAAGEFLTLLGPSGCGKTTILRMISGFEAPTSGAVLLEGRDVTCEPPYRRDVNQVFQSYALFGHLNVERNIEFGLKMKRLPRAERRRRVAEAIELVDLAGLETRRPSQLSGGQKQRVALARAIVNHPRVLLLDEPLAALDAKLRRSMQIELKHLQRQLGMTFVFVTHDQEEALTMSDRIAVMNAGRIEQLGTGADVYHRPASAFVADFIGQTNLLDAAAISPTQVRTTAGLELTVEANGRDRGALLLSIRPEKLRLSEHSTNDQSNAFPVRVVEQIFRGEIVQLLIECEQSHQRLLAVVTGTHRLAPGGRAMCQIDAADIVLLQPSGVSLATA